MSYCSNSNWVNDHLYSKINRKKKLHTVLVVAYVARHAVNTHVDTTYLFLSSVGLAAYKHVYEHVPSTSTVGLVISRLG